MFKMKRMHLVILMLCLVSAPCMAAEAEKTTASEVHAMLQTHDKALNEQDITGVMATYASAPNIVLMGTGPGELWVGKDEIQAAYGKFFKDFDKGTLAIDCGWKDAEIKGDAGWIMAICKFSDASEEKKREYGLNISAVLTKQEGKWLFQTFHFSNLTGQEK
jgi:uncharacterized protein (TIGR02246 family)